jgi:hypothetical protein
MHRLYETLQNPHVELRVNCYSHVQRYTKCYIIHNFSKPRVDFVDTLYVCLVIMEFEWDEQKNFQSFVVICRKPHVASSICLRATIFQNPEWTLWTHCMFVSWYWNLNKIKKNFRSFAVICRNPHVASSICLRATIFQSPEWTLWTHLHRLDFSRIRKPCIITNPENNIKIISF